MTHRSSGRRERASWIRGALDSDPNSFHSNHVSNISDFWGDSECEMEADDQDSDHEPKLRPLNPTFVRNQNHRYPCGLRMLISRLPSSHRKSDLVVRTFDFLLHRAKGVAPQFVAVKTIFDVLPRIISGDLLVRFHLTIFHDHSPSQTAAKMKTRARLYEYEQDDCKFKPLGKARINLAFLDL